MSFQKAHNISNELGEVLVTTPPIVLTARQTHWALAVGTYPGSAAIAGRSYRVLEVGCTIQTAGTAVHANQMTVGILSDLDAFVQLNNANLPAATVAGETYSTGSGGASTWTFRAAGTGNVDSDGNPFLNPGQQLVFRSAANVGNTPTVIFFARLAPVASRDVFA